MQVSVVLTNKGDKEACNIRLKISPSTTPVQSFWGLETEGKDWGLPGWARGIAGGSDFSGIGLIVVSEAVPSFQIVYDDC